MTAIAIEKLAFSAGKDHTIMEGGTFTADKIVRAHDELRLYQYFLPVAAVTGGYVDLFSGVHSVEHALAYSPETGSLRAAVADVAASASTGDQVIDVSPYVAGVRSKTPTIGFRVTYVAAGRGITQRVLAASFRHSFSRMRAYYDGGGAAPFSTPEQCGQYNTHSPVAALGLIALAEEQLAHGRLSGGKPLQTRAQELYICDLRLVRPRAAGDLGQRVLAPLAGHLISQHVEQRAGAYLPGASLHMIKTGNFGCSTGEYVMLANPEKQDMSGWLRLGHVAITRVLFEMAAQLEGNWLDQQAAADAAFSLEHVRRSNPIVYTLARQVSR